MISLNSPISIQALSYSHRASSTRLAIPVRPSAYIYSHFKHVQGRPADGDNPGVSISKLKILDVLVERLSQLRKEKPNHLIPIHETREEDLNLLIHTYKNEIEKAEKALSLSPYGPKFPQNEGLLFSLLI